MIQDGPYSPLARSVSLTLCGRCGAVVARGGTQVVHDNWHNDEVNRIRSASGTQAIGDPGHAPPPQDDYVRGSERPLPHRWDA